MPRNPNKIKCGAKSKVYGEDGYPILINGKPEYKPCDNWAMKGSNPEKPVCDIHGGRNPIVQDANKRRLVEQGVERTVGRFLESFKMPNVNPMEELLEVVAQTGALVRLYEMMVHELDPGISTEISMEGGTVYTKPIGIVGPDHLGDVRANVLIRLYREALVDHAKVCKMALEAGIEERLVRVASGTMEQLFVAIERALDATGMTFGQREQFKTTLATELRRVVGADVSDSDRPALASG